MADPKKDVYRAELQGIRAPLGVILYLIRKNNLDIYDIPIAKITKEYLDFIDMMEQMQIDLAGEFFVLAATLMRIKVQMLLRRKDDEEDPREELIRNLIEYQKMLEAAKSLRSLEEQRLKIYPHPVRPEDKNHPAEVELELNLYELMKAFREVVANMGEDTVVEIEPESFTVDEKIDAVLSALEEREQLDFYELFRGSSSRFELIVTFIALLELIRRSEVKVRQQGAFGRIWLYRSSPEPDEGEELKQTGVKEGDTDG